MKSWLRSALLRQGSHLHQKLWLTRAMTLGVRAVVLDEARGVFLVRHTYLHGWYLPGGGVDRGETAEAAIIRELIEEGGIRCCGRPLLHGLYGNGRRDHVACYVVRGFDLETRAHSADWEIAEAGIFPLDALPAETTRATRARLEEVLGNQPISASW